MPRSASFGITAHMGAIGLVILVLYIPVNFIKAAPTRSNFLSENRRELHDEMTTVYRAENVSNACYRSRRECDARCSVSCEHTDECEGVTGTWYRCGANHWLVIILIAVICLFAVVFLVACQCVDKGQGCQNVDLYPRILGNHRRGQRRGVNTVQYFTAVRSGRQGRKMSALSQASMRHQRASVSSQTPLTASCANPSGSYRFL